MYDLLLKGGTVVDAASGLDGVLDVAIEKGKIARFRSEERIPVLRFSGMTWVASLLAGMQCDESPPTNPSHAERVPEPACAV